MIMLRVRWLDISEMSRLGIGIECWLGVPFQALGVVFFRIPMLFKVFKREKPGKKRTKLEWKFEFFSTDRAGRIRSEEWRFWRGNRRVQTMHGMGDETRCLSTADEDE